jgi:cellulose synthase/poly-beta-1,6-N-acetylglucosamine synthase-like glycosyltransferase
MNTFSSKKTYINNKNNIGGSPASPFNDYNYFVSILIPLSDMNDYLLETLDHIFKMDFKNFEVIILPDDKLELNYPNTTIIPTGKVSPAKKRDIGAGYSKGDILAFIDDDAYPDKMWLTNALPFFNDENVGAVGGPAVTPDGDGFWQKVSGAVFLTKLGGGNPERYLSIGKVKEIDDWPSVNLLIKKDLFDKINGFDSEYWPGEDTKLCLDVINGGKKIIYAPDVLVYHHRRPGLIKHLRQIGSYGLHRGYFAKRYPKNSFKLYYFFPTFLVLYFILFLFLAIINKKLLLPFSIGLLIYILALCFAFFDIYKKVKNLRISFVSIYYIFLTHIWYGIKFFYGFFILKNLKSKLR